MKKTEIRSLYKKLLVIFFLINLKLSYSQIDTSMLLLEYESIQFEQMEDKIDNTEEEYDYFEETEVLFQEINSKISINYLSYETAAGILKLTDYQYYQLQLYIENFGSLASENELAAIDGFTVEDVKRLSPWLDFSVRIDNKKQIINAFKNGKSELLLRYERVLEKKEGYDTAYSNPYLGSPDRISFRYKFTAGKIFSMGFAAEKDAGEELFRGSQKRGFDHYGFHIHLKNIGILKSLAVGDFQLGFGQGLVIGSGLMGSKGGGASGIRKFSSGIHPLTPMNDGSALKGAGLTLGNNSFYGTVFYAFQFFDGNLIKSDSDQDDVYDGSFSVNGYHRSENEIKKRHTLRAGLYGGDFTIRKKNFKIEVKAIKTDYSALILPKKELYKKYELSGKNNINAGIDYQVIIHKNILFGETAVSKDWGFAILQGFITELDPRMKLSALVRYYDKKYRAFNSRAFGENSHNNNEFGLYIASDIIPGRKTELQFYGDIYFFPWLRFRTDKPTSGLELATRIKFEINKNCHLIFRYHYKRSEQNFAGSIYYKTISQTDKNKIRICLQYRISEQIKLKSEADIVINQMKATNTVQSGFLIFQDLSYSFPKINLDINCRVAIFDTDSYEERIYAYEQDLYYMFNITGYYYQGWRGYLMVKYRYKFIDLWIRLAQTFYINSSETGSGAELIHAAHKTEIKTQLLFHF